MLVKAKLFLFSTVILVLILTPGCKKAKDSDEIKQYLIYTNYELTYDSEDDLTTVKANFRHLNAVGRQLKLTSPSIVRFNNEPLPEVTEPLTNATYYKKEMDGFIELGVFSWTDGDGKVYNNEIQIKTADFPEDLLEISTANDFELFWLGDALSDDDRVRLAFNVTGGINKNYNQNEASSESITIPVDDLEVSSPGFAELTLERRYRPGLQEKTQVGGRITSEYFSTTIGVDLIE